MGWTSYHATNYKNGKIDRKKEVEQYFNDEHYEIVKSALVGTTVYAAIKYKKTGDVFGVVALTRIEMKDYFNFAIKIMDETEEPYYYDCPESILKLLSPTDHEYANKWRNACREKAERKKSPMALKNLPIGAKIRFKYGDKILELVKHEPAYQFTRPFWMNEEDNTYCPVNRIPDNYEVVSPNDVNTDDDLIESENGQLSFLSKPFVIRMGDGIYVSYDNGDDGN